MWCGAGPGRSNAMVFGPGVALASMIAARRLQPPAGSVQSPSPTFMSAPSVVSVTTKVALGAAAADRVAPADAGAVPPAPAPAPGTSVPVGAGPAAAGAMA